MAEPGDELSRRYRALAREEPPAALDAAILASSRRAVGALPGGARRWAGPVSIAAVLVLGIGVTLRMQQERPGIETSAPMSEYQMPDTRPELPAAPAAKPEVVAPRQLEADAAKPAEPKPSPPPLAKRSAPASDRVMPQARLADAAPAVAPPPAATTLAAPPAASIAMPTATAPPPPPAAAPVRRDPAPEQTARDATSERGARDMSGEAAIAPRAKREAASANEARALGAPSESAADMLERIAKLRGEGRHGEADKALEEFRRRYPEFRIPESTWERVRPR